MTSCLADHRESNSQIAVTIAEFINVKIFLGTEASLKDALLTNDL